MLIMASALGVAFVCVGLTELFGIGWPFQHEVSVALLCAFCLLHSANEWGGRVSAALLAIVYVVVATAEGFFAELLFGSYEFTAACTLGPHVLFGRPLFVPVAWYVSMYCALCVARSILPSEHCWGRTARVVLLAALLTAAGNVVADPVMSTLGSAGWVGKAQPEWVWTLASSGEASFSGVPIRNFVGWALISALCFSLLFALGAAPIGRLKDPLSVVGVNLCIALFFAAHPLHSVETRVTAVGYVVLPGITALLCHVPDKKCHGK